MEATKQRVFDRSGGHLALDFVNTVGGMRPHRAREYLPGYSDLIAFALQTGCLSAGQAERLAEEARSRPSDAQAALEEARALREAMHRVFLARVQHERPAPADLDALNAVLGRALSHRRLTAGDGCCALGWDEAASLDAPWWPVVAAAADLLASDVDLARVRVCAGSEAGACGWLFLDRTKARTRRWCSMQDCGNRAKARRHYAKVKSRTT
ncbi:MAG TPA: ABATE domain-containing protein [Anaeromyxobacteraceae bacterium]